MQIESHHLKLHAKSVPFFWGHGAMLKFQLSLVLLAGCEDSGVMPWANEVIYFCYSGIICIPGRPDLGGTCII